MGLAEEIAELEKLLNTGAERVATDNLVVQYDLEEIRRRLALLKQRQDVVKRPRVSQIDLGGF